MSDLRIGVAGYGSIGQSLGRALLAGIRGFVVSPSAGAPGVALLGTARCGTPETFNIDQGTRFLSVRFIQRLWRSLKYDCVYLHAFETGLALHVGLLRWISHGNRGRPHPALAGRPPEDAYFETGSSSLKLAA